MCGSQTLLSSLCGTRFVTRCACGCLHLVWDNATVRLDGRDLGSVVRYLHAPWPAPGAGLALTAREDDVQVWLLAAGLRFSAADFGAFREMLTAALASLTTDPVTPSLDSAPRTCALPN